MLMGKPQILDALRDLDKLARTAKLTVDLAIYGGAALALAFDMRAATRDVDAVIHSHRQFVRDAVRQIAVDRNWPNDWLNDGVKGFVSAAEQLRLMHDFQASAEGGLRVHIPTPEYLLAMKCMAMRLDDPDAAHDISDIKNLAKLLGLRSADQFFNLIGQFYPNSRIAPKTVFGVEEIANQLDNEAMSTR